MQQQRNQAPDYISKYGSTDRIALSCTQSFAKYGNPYGDYANELLKTLNIAWKLRRAITGMIALDPALQQQFQQELTDADTQYNEIIAFLQLHRIARPYQFNQFTGYSYVNLSASKWEGHWSKK